MAKTATDPAMTWLDPRPVPTLGDWFRAAGYRHALPRQVAHLARRPRRARHPRRASGRTTPTAPCSPSAVDAVPSAPTGSTRSASTGGSAASLTAPTRPTPASSAIRSSPTQMADLFGELAEPERTRPWLAVASFVNPHDIAFAGPACDRSSGSPRPTTPCPTSPPPRHKRTRSTAARRCQGQFRGSGRRSSSTPELTTRTAVSTTGCTSWSTRRSSRSSTRSTQRGRPTTPSSCSRRTTATCSAPTAACSRSGSTPTTKRPACRWSSPDPGSRRRRRWRSPTSHVDLLPTLLGLVGVDVEAADRRVVASTTPRSSRLPGRDLSPMLTGRVDAAEASTRRSTS